MHPADIRDDAILDIDDIVDVIAADVSVADTIPDPLISLDTIVPLRSRGMTLSKRIRVPAGIAAMTALCLSTTGCGSVFNESAAAGAGVGGAVLASKVTHNAAVASGIGLGALAGAEAGVKYVEKNTHRDQQDAIAAVAGPLAVGQVGFWKSHHLIKLEPDEAGRVTVSRTISATSLDCKEIVFSVDGVKQKTPVSAFYVATICRDGAQWKWASAEPATERWGSLQ